MCKTKKSPVGSTMEDGQCQEEEEKDFTNISSLLELAASDDAVGFKAAIEEVGYNVNETSFWYGRIISSKKMGFEKRTPLMIASIFGSKNVLKYILQTNRCDVNKACGSDGATALHCAIAGGSSISPEIVKLLLDASADISCRDFSGNRPVDLISSDFSPSTSRRKILELMLTRNGDLSGFNDLHSFGVLDKPVLVKDSTEKKEYPIDLTLPDIKNGIYSTDEFRMYSFKIKACSRAYSHDWTECPFVHPGENARRRDPRKYHYSCVPCPDFRKAGSCAKNDACEYAHGIFECWLHPAQYRTRLCKDETTCNRKVCFFAHKPEELRPLHGSTGSMMMGPPTNASYDGLAVMVGPAYTPPMTPSGASSPRSGSMRQHPTLQNLKVLSSRLKSTLSARDLDLEEQLVDELLGASSLSSWDSNKSALAASSGLSPNNYYDENFMSSVDPKVLSQINSLSLDYRTTLKLHSNFSSGFSSPPLSISPRAAALSGFARRSHSFVDRGTTNYQSGLSSPSVMHSDLSDWGSPDGKLNWGIQKDELNKLRKSSSFGLRSSGTSLGALGTSSIQGDIAEPGSPWSLGRRDSSEAEDDPLYSLWVEQLYLDQEQFVA